MYCCAVGLFIVQDFNLRLKKEAKRRSFGLVGVLFNLICAGLSSFLTLGNLLHRGWVPMVLGSMSIAAARHSAMAQYIVRPSTHSPRQDGFLSYRPPWHQDKIRHL